MSSLPLYYSYLLFITMFLLHSEASARNPCRNGECIPKTQCMDSSENHSQQLTKCRVVNNKSYVCCAKNRVLSNENIKIGFGILNSTNCGKTVSNLISNGDDASISEFPWMALLIYLNTLNETKMNCAGTLISEKYVLTAAHCITPDLVKVRLGEYDTTTNPDCSGKSKNRKCLPPVQDIYIEERIKHQNYDLHLFSNDIGLLRLKHKAILLANVQPICLPYVCDSTIFSFGKLFIAGWGRLESTYFSSVLQKAEVLLDNLQYCQEIYKCSLIWISDNHICVGSRDKIESCQGDSGSPLFALSSYSGDRKYTQYGIASFGLKNCGSNFPSVYTRVVPFLPWIADNIRS